MKAQPVYDAGKVSVCLLNYNHAHLIESTVASVLAQDCEGFELILSDDCSSDASWTLIRKLAATDSRIQAIRTPENRGMPGNANFAVARCRRPYIALLHHDDICRSDLIRRWATMLDRHPSAAFVFNAYGSYGSDTIFSWPPGRELTEGRRFLTRHLLTQWGCWVRGTAMIRRDAWLAVGGMRAEFGLLADVDLWMRLAQRFDVAYVPEPLLYVRQARPKDYPEEYGSREWSWRRQQILYRIHAANHRELMRSGSPLDGLRWLGFRWRLSAQTIQWLCYAVVRKRWSMLEDSPEGAVPEELTPVGWLRNLLRYVFVGRRPEDAGRRPG